MLFEIKMLMYMRNDNDDDGDVSADGREHEDFLASQNLWSQRSNHTSNMSSVSICGRAL